VVKSLVGEEKIPNQPRYSVPGYCWYVSGKFLVKIPFGGDASKLLTSEQVVAVRADIKGMIRNVVQ
jgi:hypothetical protein